MKTRSRFGRIVAGLLLGVSIFVLIQPLPVEALKEYAIGSSSIKPRLDNSVNAAIIYVDDDFDESTEGWEIDRFAAIQPAIDIAEVGDVVQVAPGDYPGQLVIDKDLTLTGSNKASRILATAYMESYFTTSYPNYPVVFIKNNANVTIEGFTIDGDGLGDTNYRFMGIGFNNAGGSVVNNDIIDIRNANFNGSQHGVGVYAYNDDSVQRTITISGNTINGFQKNAMALNSADNTPLIVDVQNNIITGAGFTPITAQNGIQVWSDLGSGIVSGNTISGIGYDNTNDPIKYVGTSILNFYADLDVTSNTITYAQEGIYFIDGSGLIDGNDLMIAKAGVSANGINAADPPSAVPDPLDLPEKSIKNSIMVLRTTSTVEISNNTLTFPDLYYYGSIGIQADTGYGSTDLSINIHHNLVSGFDKGLVFNQCDPANPDESCTETGYTDIDVVSNNINQNQTGIYLQGPTFAVTPEIHFNRIYKEFEGFGITSFTPTNINAENNWWGCSEGPMLPGSGYSCAPIDDGYTMVDSNPWLVASYPSINVYVGESAEVVVDMTHNFDLVDTSSEGLVPDGIVGHYVVDLGSVNPEYATSELGYLKSTYTAPESEGSGFVCVYIDTEDVCGAINVEPNDIPVAESQSVQTDEDKAVDILLTANDDYPGSLTWSVGDPGHGTLSGEAPDLIYTPAPDWNGEDRFTFTVNDGMADSNVATVTITVDPVNDPPTAPFISDVEWLAREANSISIPPFTDIEGNDLTYTASLGDGGPLPIWLIFDDQALTLSGTPANSHTGVYQIKITASDGIADSSTTFTLTVVLNPFLHYLPIIGR